MKILFASSEAVPYCKTGGLADVAGALVLALKQKRQDVRLILPKYKAIQAQQYGLKRLNVRLTLPLGDSFETASLWEGRLNRRVPVYFVDIPKYFGRDGLYRDASGKDFTDNDDRFILFSRAVLETAKALDFRPDIIHAQDWQTGLIPAYLKTVYRIDAFFIPTATVFTIHNIAYQGLFPKNTLFHAGFSWADFTPDGLEFYDQMNFLKAGLAYATILNTVSPAYAQEVQTTNAYGRGMEGLLQKRTKDFFGILNGIDLKEWNPAKDPLIPHPFTAKRLEPRALDKAELQRISRLTEDPRAPILGMVSRLDPQKGFDILLDIVEEFLRDGVQISVLGQGERSYLATLRLLARKYPHQASVSSNFNEPLAHKIYAGCDIFLMPSRFEPCGLGQMIALRYGAVPVVTPTGGLKDTVTPFDPQARKGLGFVSTEIGTPAYRQALLNAVRLYRWAPDVWKKLMGRGMACSFGWEQSVEKYLEIYRLALSRKQHSSPD